MDRFLVSLTLACFFLVGLLVFVSVQEQKEWEDFAAANNCKVVGKTKGTSSIGTGVTSNGQFGVVSIYNPGKTGYECDDGVTYWR